MIKNSLLATKLYIPQTRSDLVNRTHLTERLNMGLRQKMTLISAPAGFGKTTLVADWLEQYEIKTAWISLDKGDNDPALFMSYFFAALLKSDDQIRHSVDAVLESSRSLPMRGQMEAFINEMFSLGIQDKIVIVLDDYHLIENKAIHQTLNFLIENQPPQLHLVIISRQDPPFTLSLLRARGEMMEIRLADLRFDRREAQKFLNEMMGLDLTLAQIEVLESKTEGWVSGLQLAALSIQGDLDVNAFVNSFAGNNRYILDYLIDQVYQQQTETVQNFLLQTSILEQMTASLCDALLSTEQTASSQINSQEILEQLERANLFIIPLDGSREWFRYHHLFGELLRHRLRLKNDDIKGLHIKAGNWLAQEGFASKAIEHYLLASDHQTAADLIFEESDGLIKRGENATLIRWAGQLPNETMIANPALCLKCVWALALSGQEDEAEAYLKIVESQVERSPALAGNLLTAQIHIARARHDHANTIQLSKKALSMIPEDQEEVQAVLNLNLGIAYWQTGQTPEAQEALQEARHKARRANNYHVHFLASSMIGIIQGTFGNLRQAFDTLQKTVGQDAANPANALALMELGMLHYEWNQLEEAYQFVQDAIMLAERSGNIEVQSTGYRNLSLVAQAMGKDRAALAAIENAIRCVGDSAPDLTQGRNSAAYVRVLLAQGDIEQAEHLAQDMSPAAASSFYPQLYLAPARISIAKGDKVSAEAYLEEQYEKAAQANWGYGKIEVRLLQAIAASTTSEAITFLSDALVMAQPEKFLRTFLDKGKALVPLLHLAAGQSIATDYVSELLDLLDPGGPAEPGRKTEPEPSSGSSVDALSERELSVLQYLEKGKTNQEIAVEMVVSVNTVKSHLKNIYAKLGVNSRREAVAQARVRNLLVDLD